MKITGLIKMVKKIYEETWKKIANYETIANFYERNRESRFQNKIGLKIPSQIKDPEEQALSRLRTFRAYLRDFAIKENDPMLLSLNFEELTEEDMVFFQRFQMGMFHINDVERQEQVLANLKEADTARKLLSYMRKKLTKSEAKAA